MTINDPHTSKWVLVAEDHADLRDLFTRVFNRAGYSVHKVTNGAEALSWLAMVVPDLVVLDVDMPQVSGLEVLKHIRTQPELRGTRVILVTGNDVIAHTPEAAAADLCLLKPVSLIDLVNLAQRLLG